jgi:creatinine amidohydrolase
MNTYDWAECTRTCCYVLPEAVVVLLINATEQHGPHLPTGTDSLIVGAAARAAETSTRELVLTASIPFSASDHRFPFGGRLSLETEAAHACCSTCSDR